MQKFIGDRIRQAREEKNISQKKLGLILGLSDKAISAYEAGRTYPPIDTLFKIAKELDKPIFFFLTEMQNDLYITNSISKIEKQLEDISEEISIIKKNIK